MVSLEFAMRKQKSGLVVGFLHRSGLLVPLRTKHPKA